MDKRTLCILGSTGSIGRQTVEVAKKLNIQIAALAAYSSWELLAKQARELGVKKLCCVDAAAADKLKGELSDCFVSITSGEDALCELASEGELVLNAVVGIAGLKPTLAALQKGKAVLLANKESLVAAGALVTGTAAERGGCLLPVDSEHSAVFQCISASAAPVKRIILTASGGPFFGKDYKYLKSVKKEDALRHPNWSMGQKVTIDSATMMNKGLELLEAMWLFDMPQECIDVVIHRQSIVHSMVEFSDNSVLAQLGVPDMRLPIEYALCHPSRGCPICERLDFTRALSLDFAPPDEQTFPSLKYARRAATKKGLLPAAMNAANEAAVRLFLEGWIPFTDIFEFVREAVYAEYSGSDRSLSDILSTDETVKRRIYECFGYMERL